MFPEGEGNEDDVVAEPAKTAASRAEHDLLHVLRREVLNTGAAGTMAADGLMVVIGLRR